MILEVNFPPQSFQTQKSFPKLPWKLLRHLFCALLLLAGFTPVKVLADDTSVFAIIRQLAHEGLTCPDYVNQIVKLIKANPHFADAIIAEAVKDQPPCACEVVKAGILATVPQGGVPDPKLVADIVATIVQNIQYSNPELLQTIVSCALDADPDAEPQILAAIASIFTGPRAGGFKGGFPPGIPNRSPTPPQPTPPRPTPGPTVTPSSPI